NTKTRDDMEDDEKMNLASLYIYESISIDFAQAQCSFCFSLVCVLTPMHTVLKKIHRHMYVRARSHTHTHTDAHTHTHTDTHTHTHTHTPQTRTHTNTKKHTPTQTHAHTHTRTHKHTLYILAQTLCMCHSNHIYTNTYTHIKHSRSEEHTSELQSHLNL